MADADLKRLQFVKAHYFNKDDNESLYFEALQRIKNEYVKCNVGATINYEIANYIHQKAQEKSVTNTFKIKDALTIIDETIKNYPASEGAKNCAALRETIFHKNVSLITEETVIPNEAFKIAVNFKNISKLYFRLIPIKYSEKDKIFNLKDKETQADIIKRLKAIKPAASWNQTLPSTDDCLDHNTEIKKRWCKKRILCHHCIY